MLSLPLWKEEKSFCLLSCIVVCCCVGVVSPHFQFSLSLNSLTQIKHTHNRYVLEFERAVSFLATAASRANLDSDKVSWFADAVHIAIAIHHYGALRVTNNVPSSNSTSSSAYLVVQQQTEEASLKLADVFERHLAIFVHGGNLKYAFEYVFVLWQKKVTKKGTSEDLVPSYVLSLMVRILLHANSCDDVLSYLRNRLSKPQLIQVTKVAALRASELGKMKRAIKLWSLPSVWAVRNGCTS